MKVLSTKAAVADLRSISTYVTANYPGIAPQAELWLRG
jgi:hypothetical protein